MDSEGAADDDEVDEDDGDDGDDEGAATAGTDRPNPCTAHCSRKAGSAFSFFKKSFQGLQTLEALAMSSSEQSSNMVLTASLGRATGTERKDDDDDEDDFDKDKDENEDEDEDVDEDEDEDDDGDDGEEEKPGRFAGGTGASLLFLLCLSMIFSSTAAATCTSSSISAWRMEASLFRATCLTFSLWSASIFFRSFSAWYLAN